MSRTEPEEKKKPAELPAAWAETREIIERYPSDKYNRLFPTITMADVSGQLMKPVVEIVTISPSMDKDGPKEVYQDRRMAANMRAITRRGLQKINAAGCLQFPPALSRIEQFVQGKYIIYKAGGVLRSADGTPRVVTAIQLVDLELEELKIRAEGEIGIWKTVNGKRQKAKPTETELEVYVQRGGIQVRENMATNAETKAQNRVTRKAFALKDHYTTAELALPFVVFRYDTSYNLEDPAQLEAIMARAEEASGRVFGVGMTVPAAGPPMDKIEVQAEAEVVAEEVAKQTLPAYQEKIRASLIERIGRIANVYELRNWEIKHKTEVEKLAEAIKSDVLAAVLDKYAEFEPPPADEPETPTLPEDQELDVAPQSEEERKTAERGHGYLDQLKTLQETDYPIVRDRFKVALTKVHPNARAGFILRFKEIHTSPKAERAAHWAALVLELEGVKE